MKSARRGRRDENSGAPVTWQVWLAFAVLETVLCLTPGPAVLLVLSQALSRGTAKTVWAILGILTANTAYFIVSASGLGAILAASYDIFFAIKWIGAAYLVWLGLNEIFGAHAQLAIAPADAKRRLAGPMFVRGFALQMSNPKALVFFTALVPQFRNPHAALVPQIAILAVTSMVIEFGVQIFYAALAGRFTHLATRPRFAAIANRVTGSLLIAAGIGMAALRRA
jgi:homoserine/homoserine lactone efflux protein